MLYVSIIVILIHYLLMAGEAGYWLAKNQKKRSLKAGVKALVNFLCVVYIILNIL